MTTLAPFEIHRATSVGEASRLLVELADEAVVYCGGTELLLLMKLGFAAYEHLVDIKPIEELRGLEVRDGRLRIGATVTHRELERSAPVRDGWPDLVAMERQVANIRVRATGSLGGNLAFADPHSDPATFLLAAGATLELGADSERRTLPLGEFILGPYETALRPGELLCAIEVPPLGPGTAMAHLRFAIHERPAATVSARVRVTGGRISDARVAVGSVGASPVLAPDAAGALQGQDAHAIDPGALGVVAAAAAQASDPVSDANGGADYKAALVATLVSRALREATTRAASRSDGGPA